MTGLLLGESMGKRRVDLLVFSSLFFHLFFEAGGFAHSHIPVKMAAACVSRTLSMIYEVN